MGLGTGQGGHAGPGGGRGGNRSIPPADLLDTGGIDDLGLGLDDPLAAPPIPGIGPGNDIGKDPLGTLAPSGLPGGTPAGTPGVGNPGVEALLASLFGGGTVGPFGTPRRIPSNGK